MIQCRYYRGEINYCRPALSARYALVGEVRPSVCCPSRGHIKERKRHCPGRGSTTNSSPLVWEILTRPQRQRSKKICLGWHGGPTLYRIGDILVCFVYCGLSGVYRWLTAGCRSFLRGSTGTDRRWKTLVEPPVESQCRVSVISTGNKVPISKLHFVVICV